MAVIDRLACMLGRRDEVPNQELASDLVRRKDRKGIREIAENLRNPDRNIASDCIKVLYEVGEREPSLASQYAGEFLALLGSTNNRMVWGAVSGIASIAHLAADELFPHHEEIVRAVECGSVITQDKGIAALAVIAAAAPRYRKAIVPFLLRHLDTCRPKDIPQHSEKSLVAVDRTTRAQFVAILNKRFDSLTPPQQKRVAKVIQQAVAL